MASTMATDISFIISLKKELKEKIRKLLSEEEAEIAARDAHAKRSPRPCGLTIHTSIGCVYQCRYCYIYDMGFKPTITPYPLTGIQLVYALLLNKYFIPSANGTYLAIGSVSEPFHLLVKEKTIEYIKAIYTYLGNPVQFSTKAFISKYDAEKIAKASNNKISPLITIITMSNWHNLEPYAPTPEKRLETVRNLREAGLKPFLFIRPIIPGVTDREFKEIIDLGGEYGAVGVVAGGLRVTKNILEKLREAGANVGEILRRLRVPPEKMKPGMQYEINVADIKTEIQRYARKKGLVYFPSACMANLYTHGMFCWRMMLYNVKGHDLKKPSQSEISNLLREMNFKPHNIVIGQSTIVAEGTCSGCDPIMISEIVKHSYKICLKLHIKRNMK